jgi:phage-related protein
MVDLMSFPVEGTSLSDGIFELNIFCFPFKFVCLNY